ncbi:MAG: M20/M25/M40 family metallo-hydrolase [Gemmatimonadales bacterium]|jgi:endoglucanase
MATEIRDLLTTLLDAPGPSGYETLVTAAWRDAAAAFADRVWTDIHGNAFAEINPDGSPTVMMAGHADEIGVMANHIDDDGYVWVVGVGGWDAQVLVGQRIEFLTKDGAVTGVVGRRAIHMIRGDEGDKAVKLKDLWVDIGASSGDEARGRVEIGDVGVIRSDTIELGEGLLAARSIDNRVGAAVVLDALRRAAEGGAKAHVVACATAQEEIGYLASGGARTGAYGVDPDVGIVVDVTHATDHPTVEKKEHGDIKLGKGPVLARGAALNRHVVAGLQASAQAAGIAVQLQATPAMTGTDVDAVRMSRSGVPVGLVSVPNRYMHSPNQIVSIDDVDAAAELIAAWLKELDEDSAFAG